MANVFEAKNYETGELVALKIVTQRIAGEALPYFLAHLAQEANCLQALADSGCCQVPHFIEFHEVKEYGYIAMELLSGNTLTRVLKQGPLSRERSLNIAIKVARTISQANALGIIHRDIKPDNIFILQKDGDVRIIDFGLALVPDSMRHVAPNPDIFMGSPAYASPFHGRHASQIDGRDEAWSIAVILYEMLTGRRAYPADDPRMAREAINSLRLPPRSDLDDAIWSIISRALSDRQTQYSSVAELQTDLERVLNGLPPLPVPVPPRSRLKRALRQRIWLVIAVSSVFALIVLRSFYPSSFPFR